MTKHLLNILTIALVTAMLYCKKTKTVEIEVAKKKPKQLIMRELDAQSIAQFNRKGNTHFLYVKKDSVKNVLMTYYCIDYLLIDSVAFNLHGISSYEFVADQKHMISRLVFEESDKSKSVYKQQLIFRMCNDRLNIAALLPKYYKGDVQYEKDPSPHIEIYVSKLEFINNGDLMVFTHGYAYDTRTTEEKVDWSTIQSTSDTMKFDEKNNIYVSFYEEIDSEIMDCNSRKRKFKGKLPIQTGDFLKNIFFEAKWYQDDLNGISPWRFFCPPPKTIQN
jgi:hypothetical protein